MNSYSARTMAKCLIFAWGASTSSAIARRPAEKPAKFSYHVVGSRYLHCCKQGQAKPLLAQRGMAAKAQLFSDLILSTHSISNAGLLAFSLMKSVTFFLQFFSPPPCNVARRRTRRLAARLVSRRGPKPLKENIFMSSEYIGL